MDVMADVLISASYPDDLRRREYESEASPQDIGLALAATVEAVLARGGRVVFGGHPTVTPVVLHIALLHPGAGKALLFQSRYFEDQLTGEVRRLLNLPELEGVVEQHWVAEGPDRQTSIDRLRADMLDHPLQAAFFIGGMRGVAEELSTLRSRQPRCPAFLFARPGGRAADLARQQGELLSEGDPRSESGRGGAYALPGTGYAYLVDRALTSVLGPADGPD